LLIKAGADINGLDASGQTPVMRAVFSGQFDAAYKLLQIGADYKVKDNYGHSLAYIVNAILDMPSAESHKDQIVWQEKVVSFLQEKGAW
jgi:ankyrin repeat protein